MKTKGIVLAGGKATRLGPVASVVSKQLQRVGDVPLIYHSLSYLMLAGIRDVLIISTPEAIPQFRELFGCGVSVGLNVSYAVQSKPKGLADAFIVGEEYLDKHPACMILGDNFLFSSGLTGILQGGKNDIEKNGGGHIFGYHVDNPHEFGIIEYDTNNATVLSIEEKPIKPKSNWAAIGVYFFDSRSSEIARQVKPSSRCEIEITSVIEFYLREGTLRATQLPRGTIWADAGTLDELSALDEWVRLTQRFSGGRYIAALEEIAFDLGWIGLKQLRAQGQKYEKCHYGQYLLRLAKEGRK
jgi:glucose-1-phosphate thymidylyltransferase